MIRNGVRRGDVFYVNRLNFSGGAETQKARPAVIVSNDLNNTFSNYVEVVFLTSKYRKPLPTHVNIECKVPSIVLCECVETVSKEQLGNYIKTCNTKEMKQIDEALCCSLGIDTFSFTIHNLGFILKRIIKKIRTVFTEG